MKVYEWKDVHSRPVQLFIKEFGGRPFDPELFREAMNWAKMNLTSEQKFELLFWFVGMVKS